MLTIMRIFAIPFIVVFFYLPIPYHHIITAVIFTLAAITDWVDGYLARYWQQTSQFGAFLDPVADKLLVAVALVLIVGEHDLPFIAIPAAIIVGREIVISALREWMADIGKRTKLNVTYIAKIKTTIQMIALVILLAITPGHISLVAWLGYIMLIFSAIMTIWTMVIYLKAAWPEFGLSF